MRGDEGSGVGIDEVEGCEYYDGGNIKWLNEGFADRLIDKGCWISTEKVFFKKWQWNQDLCPNKFAFSGSWNGNQLVLRVVFPAKTRTWVQKVWFLL